MNKPQFTWVKTHKQLVHYLKTQENNQPDLIELLKSVGISGPFKDIGENGEIKLNEIDPFTFFFYINKYGSERRLKYLKKIAEKLDLHIPSDDKGIPTAQPLKVWLFPFANNRKNNEVARLWSFFHKALKDEIKDDDFEDVLKIQSTGKVKLTEGLFNINPERFLPINKPMQPYLQDVLKVDPKFKSFSEYLDLLEIIKSKTDLSFFEISYEAWVWNSKRKSSKTKQQNLPSRNYREEFKIWINGNYPQNSGARSSYVKAIDILSDKINKNIFEISNNKFLEELYQDLLMKQGNKEGIYFHEDAQSYGNSKFYSASIKAFQKFLKSSEKDSSKITLRNMDYPLNTIFYGPPGTGKTYKTKELALGIVEPGFNAAAIDNRREINRKYESYYKKKSIHFTTFHQSWGYEDFIEGIKPILNSTETDSNKVNYYIEAGIFKKCCAYAAYNCYKLMKEQQKNSSIEYDFDELYEAFIDQYRDIDFKPIFSTLTGREVEIFEINKNDSIRARAKGSTSTHVAPLTKENIQKLYDTFPNVDDINNLQKVKETVGVSPRTTEFYAVFKGLKEFEYQKFKPVEKEIADSEVNTVDDADIIKKFEAGVYENAVIQYSHKASPVVLIIDEINRGNVSSIFGELITLLETDKRLGAEESLTVELAYSKSNFGIPTNLYIIGTMNTADRSVEALDTALRRRFSFKEVMPTPELLNEIEFDNFNLGKVLETINQRIEALVDRDHTIGHSYFIKIESRNVVALREAFENKIIPLLQEYFYHDYEKIALVLGEGFVERKKANVSFAKFDNLDKPELLHSFELRRNIGDIETAVRKLLNHGDEETA